MNPTDDRWLQLVASLSDAVLIEQGGRIRYANVPAAGMLAVSDPDALLGRSLMDFIEPDSRPGVVRGLQRLPATEPVVLQARRCGCKEDAAVDLELVGTLIRYQGKPAYQLVVRLCAASESAGQVVSFAELNPAPVIRFNHNGRITDANPAARRVLGQTIVDSSLARLFPDLDRADTDHLIQWGTSRLEHVCRAGQCYQFILIGLPEHGFGHAYGRDVTQLEASQVDLRLAASAFRASPMGMIIIDMQRVILRVNKAFTRITGYTAQEVVGREVSILHSGRQTPAFYRQLWSRLQQQGNWEGEVWSRRKSGDVYPQWETMVGVKDSHGVLAHYISMFTDITEKKRSEVLVHHLAHCDALTNLPKRALLMDCVQQAIEQASQQRGKVAVLFLDLDDFSLINDTLGYSLGDDLLQVVADNLRACMRVKDSLGRLGGDEFAMILTGIDTELEAAAAANRVLKLMAEPLLLQGKKIHVPVSIGISLFPDDGDDVDHLFKHADIALYRAKEQGKNRYAFFTPEMEHKLAQRQQMEEDMRLALQAQQFVLYYQPQLDLATGRIIGVEALVRWQHPQQGLVAPAEFIPLAEDTGLVIPLGRWVLEEACQQHKRWQQQGFKVRMAVNLSARQLQDKDLLELLADVRHGFTIEADMLELELTESCMMDNPEAACDLMRQIKALGFRLAMDDFGTGYSSLSYLKLFAMDTLKIDQSFVCNLPDDTQDAAIANTIIAMAHNLDMKVLAEGVENRRQLNFLLAGGCDEVQGYYFSKPVPAAELLPLLDKTWPMSATDEMGI